MRAIGGWAEAVVVLALLAAVGACSARPAVRQTAQPLGVAIAPSARILLLAPWVRFENQQTEAPLAGEAYDGAAFAAHLRDAARGAAAAAGAVVIECGLADGDVGTAALCAELAPHGLHLSRGVVRPDTAVILARTAVGETPAVVLATACLGRLGPGSYYDPNSGRIHEASASTMLTAALLGPDGRPQWKNDVLLRAVPEATDENFVQAVEMLFSAAPAP